MKIVFCAPKVKFSDFHSNFKKSAGFWWLWRWRSPWKIFNGKFFRKWNGTLPTYIEVPPKKSGKWKWKVKFDSEMEKLNRKWKFDNRKLKWKFEVKSEKSESEKKSNLIMCSCLLIFSRHSSIFRSCSSGKRFWWQVITNEDSLISSVQLSMYRW